MIEITEFDESTGESVTVARVFSICEKPGLVTVEGVYPPEDFYLKNGVVCEYTQTQKAAKALHRFEYGYQWDNTTMAYKDVRQADVLVSHAKSKRDQLLAQSDWTQLPDVPEANKLKWAVYRQALRDITKQAGYPFQITWPAQPTA